MNQVRLFVGIKLDDALCNALKHTQRSFQEECDLASVSRNSIRWVAPQNIHLTLSFLGNTERDRFAELEAAIHRATKSVPRFVLTPSGLGCFPNPRRPNAIWVGLDGELQTPALLARNLETELVELGFPRDERGFQPHLTLARVKRETSHGERARIGEIVKTFPLTTFGTLHAEAVHLISSDLRPSGPLYTTLASIFLKT